MMVFSLIFNFFVAATVVLALILLLLVGYEIYKNIIIKHYIRKFRIGNIMLKVMQMTDLYLFSSIDNYEQYIIDVTALIIDNLIQLNPVLAHRKIFGYYNLKSVLQSEIQHRRYDRYFTQIESHYENKYDAGEFVEAMHEFVDDTILEYYEDINFEEVDDGYDYYYGKDGIDKVPKEEYPEDIAAELEEDSYEDEYIDAEKEYGSLASAIHEMSEL